MTARKYFCLVDILPLLLLLITSLSAQEKDQQMKWNGLQFLEGKWIGDGKGLPGQGSGYFSFSYDLEKNIFIRKSHTEFPPKDGKVIQSHDDLLLVYKLMDGKIKAIYFDNEGHVINYEVLLSNEKKQIIFISEIIASAPRFRLVYTKIDDDKLKVSFDMAKPGSPEDFSTYIEGISYKDKKNLF